MKENRIVKPRTSFLEILPEGISLILVLVFFESNSESIYRLNPMAEDLAENIQIQIKKSLK
jgi:hypothetical protein